MVAVEAQLPKAYSDALAKVNYYYGHRYFDLKRIALRGAYISFLASLLSSSIGLGLGVGVPLLIEWNGSRRNQNPVEGEKRLAALLSEAIKLSSGEIAKSISSYSNRGQRRMAVEFLLKLREADPAKFEEVFTALSETNKSRKIKGDFENIKGETSAYRANLDQAQVQYAKIHFSVGKTLAKTGAFFIGAAFFIGEAWIAIPAFAICTGVSVYKNVAAMRREKKEPCANQLLVSLVDSMREIESSIIARDLIGSFWKGSFWRGSKALSQQALKGLRESDGEKFSEVVAILQYSRRGRSLVAEYLRA